MFSRPFRVVHALFTGLVLTAGAAAASVAVTPVAADPLAVARWLALDCGNPAGVPAADVLAGIPAPRIINLQGSVPIVTMQSFAEFLIAMGYPEASLRDPRDASLSLSSYTSSEELAGMLAWYYERDGMRPMLIGHSQGGMLVVRTLYELAGEFRDAVPVFDPMANAVEARTTIRDPYSHAQRPVVGLEVAFAAALATGTLPRILLGQWSMISRLRRIPDTTQEFTGFAIAWDPIAGNFATMEPYVAIGSAQVRNILLPATVSHIGMPLTGHLAANPVAHAWIDAYRPEAAGAPVPDAADVDLRNLVHAADLWYSIRRHWCLEGQRLLRAQGPT